MNKNIYKAYAYGFSSLFPHNWDFSPEEAFAYAIGNAARISSSSKLMSYRELKSMIEDMFFDA